MTTPQAATLSPGSNGIAADSAREARRILAIAFVGVLSLLGVLGAQALWSIQAVRDARADIFEVRILASEIRRADEALTMSANMAVASGDLSWVDRFEETLPEIDEAIAAATALASAEAAQRFDLETRRAHDVLVSMERQAFQHLREGDAERAQALLASSLYERYKSTLVTGADRLMDALAAETEARLAALRRFITFVALSTAAVGMAVLGTFMLRSIARSERIHSAMEQALRRLALHDPLTELANRASFEQTLSTLADGRTTQLLPSGDGSGGPEHAHVGALFADLHKARHALVTLDIDGFDAVNDQHGHAFGDRVLVAVAERLREAYPGQFVGRMGGDDFVALTELRGRTGATLCDDTRLVLRALSTPYVVNGVKVSLQASAGIAVLSPNAAPDDVRKGADLALVAAKARPPGSDGVARLFTEDMADAYRAEMTLRDALTVAFERDEFIPYFQPIVDLATGETVAAEALVRWQREGGEVLSPGRFVGTLGEMGRLDQLTYVMLRKAAAAATGWPTPIPISVNVPPTQLRGDFATRLLRILRDTGLPPERLEVEVLETAFASDDAGLTKSLAKLRQAGVRIALDDFGVGYSSLGQLSRLPVDKLKIDRSFIGDLDASATSGLIGVSAAENLGAAVGRAVDGEGVDGSGAETTLGKGAAGPLPLTDVGRAREPANATVMVEPCATEADGEDDGRNGATRCAVVRAAIERGEALGLTVVAEGVEDRVQSQLLQQLGCRFAQGYHFSRPVANDDFTDALPAAAPASNPVAFPSAISAARTG